MHGNLSFGQIGETSLLAAWLGQIRPTLHFPSEHGLLQKCGIKSARANPNKAQYTPVIRLDEFKNCEWNPTFVSDYSCRPFQHRFTVILTTLDDPFLIGRS